MLQIDSLQLAHRDAWSSLLKHLLGLLDLSCWLVEAWRSVKDDLPELKLFCLLVREEKHEFLAGHLKAVEGNSLPSLCLEIESFR